MLITLLDAIKHAPTISPAVIDNDTVASLSRATDVHKNTDKKTEGDFYQEGSYYYYTGKGNLICWLHLLNPSVFQDGARLGKQNPNHKGNISISF